MFENKIKTLLSQGEVALGVGMPDASEILAKLSVDTGVDFLWIDLEHRPYSVNEVKHLPIIARRAGCMPMIRVPGLDPRGGAAHAPPVHHQRARDARHVLRAFPYVWHLRRPLGHGACAAVRRGARARVRPRLLLDGLARPRGHHGGCLGRRVGPAVAR